MKNNKEINALMLEQNFFRKVMNNSFVCILIVVACFAALCLMVNDKNGICRIGFDLFGYNKTMPVIVNDSFSAESDGIAIKAESCTLDSENDMLYIDISGQNLTEEAWQADGRTFAVAVQRVNGSFSREYYYNAAENWKEAEAAAGNTFSVRLEFHIDRVGKAFDEGDVFSLVSFRSADCHTSVIVLNDLISE